MSIKEYDVGARNIHHDPTLKTAHVDVPSDSSCPVKSTRQAGPIGDAFGRRGFKMGPSTSFDYSKNRPDNIVTGVEVMSMEVWEEGTWSTPSSNPKVMKIFFSEPRLGKDYKTWYNMLHTFAGDDDLFDTLDSETTKFPNNDFRFVVKKWTDSRGNGMKECDSKITQTSTSFKFEDPIDFDYAKETVSPSGDKATGADDKGAVITDNGKHPIDEFPESVEKVIEAAIQAGISFPQIQKMIEAYGNAPGIDNSINYSPENSLRPGDVLYYKGNPRDTSSVVQVKDGYVWVKQLNTIESEDSDFPKEKGTVSKIYFSDVPKYYKIKRNWSGSEKPNQEFPEAEDKKCCSDGETCDIDKVIDEALELGLDYSQIATILESLEEAKKEPKKWIQKAVNKMEKKGTKGSLTKAAKKAGESTKEFAKEHEHSKGKVGQKARFALNVAKGKK